jgi:hypothetical protein
MLFKNSVRTSKRTPHFTVTKINWLTLFKEIIAVYSERRVRINCGFMTMRESRITWSKLTAVVLISQRLSLEVARYWTRNSPVKSKLLDLHTLFIKLYLWLLLVWIWLIELKYVAQFVSIYATPEPVKLSLSRYCLYVGECKKLVTAVKKIA